MIKRLFQSLLVRAEKELWSLSPASALVFLILLFLPTQLGKHFWPSFSLVSGLRIDYLSPTVYFTDVLLLILFVLWLFENYSSVRSKFPISPSIPSSGPRGNFQFPIKFRIVLLVVMLLVGILLSESPLAGAYYLLKITEFSFLGFYVSRHVKKEIVARALGVGLVFESLLAILQYVNVGSLGGVFYFFGERAFNSQTPGIANASINGALVLRPYATFSHPNVLAAYLVLAMIIVVFAVRDFRVKAFLLSLGSLALVLTLSRVAILGWIFIAGIYLFKRYFLSFLAIGVLFLLLSPFGFRFTSFSLAEEAVTHRIILSKAAWEMFVYNPLLGTGLNNFLPSLPFFEKTFGQIFLIQPVHNIFLLALSEVGVLGVAVFASLLFKTLKRVGGRKNYLSLTLLGLVFLLGFFDHYFLTAQQGQMMLALIFGICWSDTIS